MNGQNGDLVRAAARRHQVGGVPGRFLRKPDCANLSLKKLSLPFKGRVGGTAIKLRNDSSDNSFPRRGEGTLTQSLNLMAVRGGVGMGIAGAEAPHPPPVLPLEGGGT